MLLILINLVSVHAGTYVPGYSVAVKGQLYGVNFLLLTRELQELNLGLSALEANDFTHWVILLVTVAQANLELTTSTITIPNFT